jgi:hypothetical protein
MSAAPLDNLGIPPRLSQVAFYLLARCHVQHLVVPVTQWRKESWSARIDVPHEGL